MEDALRSNRAAIEACAQATEDARQYLEELEAFIDTPYDAIGGGGFTDAAAADEDAFPLADEEVALSDICDNITAVKTIPAKKTHLDHYIGSLHGHLSKLTKISQGLYLKLIDTFERSTEHSNDGLDAFVQGEPLNQVRKIQGMLDKTPLPGSDENPVISEVVYDSKDGSTTTTIELYKFHNKASPREPRVVPADEFSTLFDEELDGFDEDETFESEKYDPFALLEFGSASAPADTFPVVHALSGTPSPIPQIMASKDPRYLVLQILEQKIASPLNVRTTYCEAKDLLLGTAPVDDEEVLLYIKSAFAILQHPDSDSFFDLGPHSTPGSYEFAANILHHLRDRITPRVAAAIGKDKGLIAGYNTLWGEASMYLYHVMHADVSEIAKRPEGVEKRRVQATIKKCLKIAKSYAPSYDLIARTNKAVIPSAGTVFAMIYGVDAFNKITDLELDIFGYDPRARREENGEITASLLQKATSYKPDLPLDVIANSATKLGDHIKAAFGQEAGKQKLPLGERIILFHTLRQVKQAARDLLPLLQAVDRLTSRYTKPDAFREALIQIGLGHLIQDTLPKYEEIESQVADKIRPHLLKSGLTEHAAQGRFPAAAVMRSEAHKMIKFADNDLKTIINIAMQQRFKSDVMRSTSMIKNIDKTIAELGEDTPFPLASKILFNLELTLRFRFNENDPFSKELSSKISGLKADFTRIEFVRLQSVMTDYQNHDYSQFNRPTQYPSKKRWPLVAVFKDEHRGKEDLFDSPVSASCSCNATMTMIHMLTPGRPQEGLFPFDQVLDEGQVLYYHILKDHGLGDDTTGVTLSFDALRDEILTKGHLIPVEDEMQGSREIVEVLTRGQEQDNYKSIFAQLEARIPAGKTAIGGLIQNNISIYSVHIEKSGDDTIYTIVDSHGLNKDIPTAEANRSRAFKVSFKSIDDAALFLQLHHPYSGTKIEMNTCVVLPVIGPDAGTEEHRDTGLLTSARTKHVELMAERAKHKDADRAILTRCEKLPK